MSPSCVKVAIIGSGLSGLTAAYLLSKAPEDGCGVHFEVHLFEKSPVIGVDAHSVSLGSNDKDQRIDVPMRSFQGGYYPQLIAMYNHLHVQFVQANFSYSFSSFIPSCKTILTNTIYNGASGRKGVSMPSALFSPACSGKNRSFSTSLATWIFTMVVFALSTAGLMLNYLRTIVLSVPFLRPADLEYMTFREWCKRSRPSGALSQKMGLDDSWRDFCSHILVPLFSAVCTAPEESVLDHPVEEFLDYIWLTLFTHHYLVIGGVRDIVKRLSSSIQHVHLNATISNIKPDPTNPRLVSIECASSTKVYHGFSHIIIATQANCAVLLLKSYLESLSPSEQATQLKQQLLCLETFNYAPNIVINHTDDSLLPSHPRNKRDLNLVTIPIEYRKRYAQEHNNELCVGASHTMATQILPQPTSCSHPMTVYQTTNPVIPPRADAVLSVARLERAVLTVKGKKALAELCTAGKRMRWQCVMEGEIELGRLQGARIGEVGPRVWICGSYAHFGIPLLEGCVVSGRNVVEKGIFPQEGVSPLNLW